MAILRIGTPQLAVGQARSLQVGNDAVLLCRSASGLHAIRDVCPHQALSLDGARIRGTSLFCPHHGARFSLEDGRSLSALCTKPLELYVCREHGNELEIERNEDW